jgi:kynurenine formamidase
VNDNANPDPVFHNTITYRRVIDLSRVIHPNIPRWPGDPPVEFETVARIADQGYYLRRFSLGEHTGTHINAPSSFDPGGISIDRYCARSLIAPAIVLDLADRSQGDADYLLTVEDVLAWERRFGPVPPGCLALLYSRWQEKWDAPRDFLDLDARGRGHFPGFGIEAARFLVDQRRIGGIGIDTHGVDGGRDRTFAVNRLLLDQPRIVLENLANLERLPPTGSTLAIGMLRLEGGSGSPASVLALVP